MVGRCPCAVGVCPAWSISGKRGDKLGLPDSNIGNADSCCGESSGVFNTPCTNCPAGEATYFSKGLVTCWLDKLGGVAKFGGNSFFGGKPCIV